VWSAVLTVLCVGLTATAWASPSNLVTNGSFELPGFSGSYKTLRASNPSEADYLTGWHITAGSVDLIGSYWQASQGKNSLDLSGNQPGTIAQQSIATTPGASYLLLFDMAGNPDGRPTLKTMDVLWTPDGGSESIVMQPQFTVTGQTTHQNMGWTTYSVLLKATANQTTLGFRSTTTNSPYGPALDNVRLYAVPEGPSGLLLLPGLLPIAVLVRRRRS
jgi:choice-of-anchor C domain-containing protein